MPLRNLTVIFVMAVFSLVCYQKAEHNRYASSVAEAMRLVEDFYVEEVEQRCEAHHVRWAPGRSAVDAAFLHPAKMRESNRPGEEPFHNNVRLVRESG